MDTTVPSCCYRVSVKALITDNEHKVLLIKHSNGTRELPGGGLELGENPQECLSREIEEEMGLKTTFVNSAPKYFITTPYIQDIYIANIIYEAHLESLDFKISEECVEINFFSKDEALEEKNIYENVKEFFKVYQN